MASGRQAAFDTCCYRETVCVRCLWYQSALYRDILHEAQLRSQVAHSDAAAWGRGFSRRWKPSFGLTPTCGGCQARQAAQAAPPVESRSYVSPLV